MLRMDHGNVIKREGIRNVFCHACTRRESNRLRGIMKRLENLYRKRMRVRLSDARKKLKKLKRREKTGERSLRGGRDGRRIVHLQR